MKESIAVFPDTNVFLHFPPINQIDWKTICDAKSVQLVVCLTVIHELDAKKSDSRLAGRAERSVKSIREAVKSGLDIREGVSVVVYNKEVRSADFPDTLSPDSADDRIVHLAKLYKSENPESEVAIVTGDYGMELRAEAGGITAMQMQSSLRLENPQDEQTKKYRQAVAELNSLKNRQPELAVRLAVPDGEMGIPHETIFKAGDVWQPLDVDAEIQKAQKKYPHVTASQMQPSLNRSALILFGEVSAERRNRYNEELNEFYSSYRDYLELANLQGKAKANAFEFDLWLSNTGNGLATDIDVTLRFPVNIQLLAEKGTEEAEPLENISSPPQPPEKPKPDFNLGVARLDSHLDRIRAIPNLIPDHIFRADDWTPAVSVERGESGVTETHARIGKLKHGHSVCLGKFIAMFALDEDVKPFRVDCVISTSDLAEKKEEAISFRVQR